MRHEKQSWQLAVFVGAILLPSAALVMVSQRTMSQNRELAAAHRQDQARAARERLAGAMLSRLEAIKAGVALHPASASDPAIALVARVDGGRLLLPGDPEAAEQAFRDAMDRSPAFRAALRRGEQSEFERGGISAAVESYREALRFAATPLERAVARYQLAGALARQGDSRAAAAEARQVLETPADLADADGVPLALRAVGVLQLVAGAEERVRLRQVLETAIGARRWHSANALTIFSRLIDQLKPEEDPAWRGRMRERWDAAYRLLEQAQRLQNDGVWRTTRGASWTLYPAAEPWLVSSDWDGDRPRFVVAVRAREFFRPFELASKARFFPAAEPGGELLGDAFPGVKAALAAPEDAGTANAAGIARLYYAAMFLLVGATGFGTFVLWRSLRREVELAEMRSQFVASVSHELKTPLTAIRMFAETLQMGGPEDKAVQHEYLDTITNECDRLARLVDDVLLFSKMEQGKMVYRHRPLELAGVLHTAARTLSYPLAKHGFELRMEMDEDLPPVNADADALQQAVLNLVTNAMKYSGARKEIELALRRQNGDAAIQVTDFGVGIAPADLPRVFEKYYRAPTAENRAIPGTGLGLTLVAEIARAHGGSVDVKSVVGEGSTFTIRLPLRSEA